MSFGTPPRRSADPPGSRRPPNLGRLLRRRWLIPVAAAVIIVIAVGDAAVNLATDWLWYGAAGYRQVLTTRLGAQALLFVVFGLGIALVVAANIGIAYRLRPAYRPLSPEQKALDQYRSVLEPRRRLTLAVIAALTFLFGGLAAAGHWQTWLMWRYHVPFGVKDAQFHKDVAYFAFTYPFQRFVLGFAFAAILVALIAALVTHYVVGGIRLQTPGEKVTAQARAHIATLLGLFVLLKAVAYFLDRYGLAFSSRGLVTGPSYTDVNAVLPAKAILAVVAVICAILFFATVWTRGWLAPAVALGLLVVSAIVIGGVYPAAIQKFQVQPSEASKEAPYIARNITATRAAYGLTGHVQVQEYDATSEATAGQLRNDAGTTASIRLLDPNVVAPTFDQLQQIRGYYGFPDTLDIDRYPIGGKLTDTVVAVRGVDLSGLQGSQDNWINQHTVYTHGFGFVAAAGNAVDPDGKPEFVEQDIPPTGLLGKYQPRVYYAEGMPSYSVVGAPKGSKPVELDRPDDTAPGGTGQISNTYAGKGGVKIGSFERRVLYALAFREKNLLLSNRLNADSRIIYVRDPRQRVAKVAPFLRLDGDPYPAVVGGRIVWIVDGYTTSDGYPYSQRTSVDAATRDTLTTGTTAVRAQKAGEINYIRNSVKATVDAYDGTVTLYTWDSQDPVLKTWKRIFPGLVKPHSAIPADLMTHLRYPEDLFKVQRDILAKYHVTDASAFYVGQDFWRIPDDPTKPGDTPQPPYYLTLRMPGTDHLSFSLTTSLVPQKRANMAAFVAVNSQPGPDYGTIRVLQLPRNTQISGPSQVDNNFEAYPPAATTLSLLRRGGSDVTLGNLLTLPVGGGLLYVEPVYVTGRGSNSYPLLQKVLVAFGDNIAFADNLQQGLDAVFQGSSGATTATSPTTGAPPVTSGPAGTPAAVQAAIDKVNALFQQAQTALKSGDLVTYGQLQQQLGQAISDLVAAEKAAGTSGPAVSPSPSASP